MFKARIRSMEDYTSPEGMLFEYGKYYECHIKQKLLPSDKMPDEDTPMFIEIIKDDTKKIGMLRQEFLKNFVLLGKCEYCGAWFECDFPEIMCEKCSEKLNSGYTNFIKSNIIDNPENYGRLKDRFEPLKGVEEE